MANKLKKSKLPWIPKRKPSGSNQVFYNSWKWRKRSKAYKVKNPICEVCEAKGRIRAVIEPGKKTGVTDHIIPIEQGGSPTDERNLMSMCSYIKDSCHDRKRALESRGVIVAYIFNDQGEKIPRDRNDIVNLLNQ